MPSWAVSLLPTHAPTTLLLWLLLTECHSLAAAHACPPVSMLGACLHARLSDWHVLSCLLAFICAGIRCVPGSDQHVREPPCTNIPGGVPQAASCSEATPSNASSWSSCRAAIAAAAETRSTPQPSCIKVVVLVTRYPLLYCMSTYHAPAGHLPQQLILGSRPYCHVCDVRQVPPFPCSERVRLL
jgi:hypothetical protein